MMTWVQTQKLRRDEASLMTEWQTRWAQSACFNADGVVDYERWSAKSVRAVPSQAQKRYGRPPGKMRTC